MIHALACLVAVAVAAPASADEKVEADKLVGKWKLTKANTPSKTKSAFVVYAKNGTLTADIEMPERKYTFRGTWKVAGNKLVVNWKDKLGKEVQTKTIIKLTPDELVIRGDDGEQEEFRRVKEEKK